MVYTKVYASIHTNFSQTILFCCCFFSHFVSRWRGMNLFRKLHTPGNLIKCIVIYIHKKQTYIFFVYYTMVGWWGIATNRLFSFDFAINHSMLNRASLIYSELRNKIHMIIGELLFIVNVYTAPGVHLTIRTEISIDLLVKLAMNWLWWRSEYEN